MRAARSGPVVLIVLIVLLALAAPLGARPLAAGPPPALHAYAGAGMIVINADAPWTTKRAVTLKLNASSMGGAVTKMRFSVDRSSWSAWESYAKTRAYTLPAGDGANKVVFVQFENSAGDRRIDYDTIGLDTVAPESSDDADLKLHDAAVTVTLTAADATSGVAAVSYRLDGGPWQSGSSFTVPAPAGIVRAYAVDYFATDIAGNAESPHSCTVKIDTVHDVTVPVTTSSADDAWRNSDVRVTFAVSGPGQPFTTRYRLDGGPWQTGLSFTVPAPGDHSNDGVHALEYYTTNAWDNVEDVNAATVRIDTEAPMTGDDAPAQWSQDDVVLTFSPRDTLSSTVTRYRVDKGPWQEGTILVVPANADKTNDGIHAVDYYSTDAAGNAETARACQVKINVPAIARAFTVSDAPSLQRFPALSGDTVVWQDDRNGGWDIYGSSVASPAELPLCTAAGDQTAPAISGETVVWADHRGGDWDIYAYDLASETELPLCTAAGDQTAPAISGETVVWADHRGADWDIYAYDLVSETELPLCTAAGDQTTPAISGGRIIWNDSRGSVHLRDQDLGLTYPLEILAAGQHVIDGGLIAWTGENMTFSIRAPVAVSPAPRALATGDLNRDGRADLVTAHFDLNVVNVLLGGGDGSLDLREVRSVKMEKDQSPGPLTVAIADIDRDGKDDVVTANCHGTANHHGTVSVMLGKGDGTLKSATMYPVTGHCYDAVVADLNGDGKLDVATVNEPHSVSVLLGKGDGTFRAAKDYQTQGLPQSVAAADLDDDGHADLVVANFISGTETGWVSVFLGVGDGTFPSRVDYAMGADAQDVIIADFDDDGHEDLAVSSSNRDGVYVLLGNGDGTFQEPFPAFGGYKMSSGDFNHDGVIDLVTVTVRGWVCVGFGGGDGRFAMGGVCYRDDPAWANAAAVADFNDDGCDDVAVGWSDEGHTRERVSTMLGVRPGVGVYNVAIGGTTHIRGSEDAGGYAGRPALDGNTVVWANNGVHGATLTYPQWTTELEILPEGGAASAPALAKLPALAALAAPPAAKAAGASPARWIRTRAVRLALTANSDQGEVAEMALSDGGVTYGAWVPYAESRPFTLSAGDGVKTVAVVFRDSAGLVSPVASAVIGVDTKRPATTAWAATATRGRKAALKYRVSDAASKLVWHTVQIKVKDARGKVVKKVTLKKQPTAQTRTWKFTCTLARGSYRYYVYATDAAGNVQSRVGSARLVVR